MAGDRHLFLLKGELSYKTDLFVVVCFLLNLPINGQSEFSVSNYNLFNNVSSRSMNVLNLIRVLSRLSAQNCKK